MKTNQNIFAGNQERDFFVYVDPGDRFIKHQVGLVGTFTSAFSAAPHQALMFLPNPKFKSPITPFQNNLLRNYVAEYNLEVDRMRWFSQYPSRLHAMFLFDSDAEAKNYRARHPEHVEKRILKRVKTVGDYIYSLHDSSWINFLRLQHSVDEASINNISKSYWSGVRVEQRELMSFGERWTQNAIIDVLFLGRVDFFDKALNTEIQPHATSRNDAA